jgi:hypothetical protein
MESLHLQQTRIGTMNRGRFVGGSLFLAVRLTGVEPPRWRSGVRSWETTLASLNVLETVRLAIRSTFPRHEAAP